MIKSAGVSYTSEIFIGNNAKSIVVPETLNRPDFLGGWIV